MTLLIVCEDSGTLFLKAMEVNTKAALGARRQWEGQVGEAGRCWGEERRGG